MLFQSHLLRCDACRISFGSMREPFVRIVRPCCWVGLCFCELSIRLWCLPSPSNWFLRLWKSCRASFKANSIALCRLLQMLSNNKRYPNEEGALLNAWLDKNHEAMDSYLLDVASDPNFVEGNRPFAAQTRLPEERHRRLRETLDDSEWEALHVALVHSKTHVLVRAALAPALSSSSSPGPLSPHGSTPGSGAPSPGRSRSGSRFRGEEEELAIYNDGKVRVRPARRGSLTGNALFANLSPPSLPTVSGSPLASSPFTRASPALARADVTMGSRGRSRTGSNSGSPALASSADTTRTPPNLAGLRLAEDSPDKSFYALLETLPVPKSIRLERFAKTIEPLQRANLLAEGVLIESRRASFKIGASQTELLVKLAKVLIDKEFGIKGLWVSLWLQFCFFCLFFLSIRSRVVYSSSFARVDN
jgi:hypothetical protein